MGLDLEGLQLRTEIILEEPDGETVLPGEACRRKRVQLLQTRLRMWARRCAPGCGPVGPVVVVLVTADGSGEFRVVPQPLFERLLEKVGKRLRKGKLLQKQNRDQINASHDADYIAGSAPRRRRPTTAALRTGANRGLGGSQSMATSPAGRFTQTTKSGSCSPARPADKRCRICADA